MSQNATTLPDPAPEAGELSPEVWTELIGRLSREAQRSLWWMRKGAVSVDDTVMSTLRTYLRQSGAGVLPPPEDPDSLWPVLQKQLARKIDKAAATQRYRKNKEAVRYSELAPLADGRPAETAFATGCTSPEQVEAYVAQALELLTDRIEDEQLLQVARMKLKCYTTAEVAGRLGLSDHQVRRRVSQIRSLLSQGADPASHSGDGTL